MDHLVKRYAQLGRAYTELADRFQTLDVEHMNLKRQLLPLLKTLQDYKKRVAQLEQEKGQLSTELQELTAKYEELKPLEALFNPDLLALLEDAEHQMALVDETLQEIEQDSDPDLDEAEKTLLAEFCDRPEALAMPDITEASTPASAVKSALETDNALQIPQGVAVSVH